MKRLISLLILVIAIATTISVSNNIQPGLSATPFVQQFQKQPLYRFQSARGHYLYTTSETLPAGLSDGPWESEGIACHVPSAAPHGTKAVYQLTKSDDLGVRYAFTSSLTEANAGGGWSNQGVVFYVANVKLPGTVPFYRLYKPVVPGKKKDTGIIAKFTELISGPEFTASTANILQDTNFYTIEESDKAVALNNGWVSVGVLGYVWASATTSGPTKPDLVVQKTQADDMSVTAVLRNQGNAKTGGVKYDVTLFVYDSKDNLLYRVAKQAPGLSPNQVVQVKLETGGKTLKGKHYQVKIDDSNDVAESDDDNNATAILDGPAALKLKPVGETTSIPLSLSMVDQKSHPIKIGQRDVNRIDYVLKVNNLNAFPADWYQSLTVLPPTTCDGVSTNARLLMEVRWKLDKDGKFDKAGFWKLGNCRPLMSAQQLSEVTFSMNEEQAIPDHLMVLVRDRLTGNIHQSNPAQDGAFGVGNALYSLGCTNLLGRDNDFVCKKQVGFEACENLRKHGKPIKCRQPTQQ